MLLLSLPSRVELTPAGAAKCRRRALVGEGGGGGGAVERRVVRDDWCGSLAQVDGQRRGKRSRRLAFYAEFPTFRPPSPDWRTVLISIGVAERPWRWDGVA